MLSIQQLSFLAGTFNNLINNFECNKQTCDYFKQQLSGFVNMGNVGNQEALAFLHLLGLDEDRELYTTYYTKVLPEILNQYMQCMEYMIQARNTLEAMEYLKDLKTGKFNIELDAKVEKIIRATYDLQNVKIVNSHKQEQNIFGNLNYINNFNQYNNTQEQIKSNILQQWRTFANKYPRYYIAVVPIGNTKIDYQNARCKVIDLDKSSMVLALLRNQKYARILRKKRDNSYIEELEATKEFNQMDLEALVMSFYR